MVQSWAQPKKERPCSGLWLFHLHSTVKIQPFSPIFPLAGATDKAFCIPKANPQAFRKAGATDKVFSRLSLWRFREKSINHFLQHSQRKTAVASSCREADKTPHHTACRKNRGKALRRQAIDFGCVIEND